MYKSCSRCGKIHKSGYKCTVGIEYRGGEERKLRSKYAWTMKSMEVREKANYLCEICKENGILTYDDLEVHHIEKVREAGYLLLDNLNLVCLCKEHHLQADAGRWDKEYLRELARKREDRA